MHVFHIMHRIRRGGTAPALLALAAGALIVSCTAASGGAPAPARIGATSELRGQYRSEIAAMMARSAASWNRGDLDAFADDYVPGEEATYIGRHGLVRGRAAIRDVYAPRFAPGATRDSLSFELHDVDPLGPDVANVIAWYVLSRGDSVTARGPTSLVMRRGADGRWRIVHDHSS